MKDVIERYRIKNRDGSTDDGRLVRHGDGKYHLESGPEVPCVLDQVITDRYSLYHAGDEEWRLCCDGFYEVSSLGSIRRAKPGIATFVGRPVKPVASATGYAMVALTTSSGTLRTYVHRVVAAAFIGPCPTGHVVNHRDGNKLNNALANLEYVTHRENAQHAMRVIGRHRGPVKPREEPKGLPCGDRHWSRRNPEKVARGERFKSSKLRPDDVVAMRELRAAGATVQQVADAAGVCLAQASRVLRGERWAHV